MNEAISTQKNPLAFFIDFFLNGGIHSYIDEFVESCYEQKHKNPNNVSIKGGSDIIMKFWFNRAPIAEHVKPPMTGHYKAPMPKIKQIIYPQRFLDSRLSYKLKDLLEKEVKNSKKLLLDAITKNHSTLKSFIQSQTIIIQKVINAEQSNYYYSGNPSYHTSFDFSVCMPYLQDLHEYIQKLVPESLSGNTVNEHNDSTLTHNETTKDPIEEVLGYLRGKNEEGVEIMPDAEYCRLLDVMRYIGNNKRIPEIQTKFRISEKVGILRYTFYVLMPFLDLGSLKDEFLLFLHENIYKFNDCDLNTFKTKISVPPTTLPKYIPAIILERKHNQLNRRS